jgi:hypothetical protein
MSKLKTICLIPRKLNCKEKQHYRGGEGGGRGEGLRLEYPFFKKFDNKNAIKHENSGSCPPPPRVSHNTRYPSQKNF